MLGFGQDQDPGRVLRIGIIQDGRVVHERLIKPGQSVTIGESPRNTFVFPSKDLPKRFTLFQAKSGKYFLNTTSTMSGRVAGQEQIVSLEQLRESGSNKGEINTVPIGERSRGKVVIGGITVLFQFVPAPPESARMVNRHDFRPKLLDEDDPVFIGSLALFMAMATVLMIYVWNTDPTEVVSLDVVPDRFVKVVMPKSDDPPPEIEQVEIQRDDGKPVETESDAKPVEKKAEKKPKSAAEKKAAEAARQAKKREDTIARSKLLTALIGTRGESSRDGMVEDLFADGDASIGNLQDALQDVGGVEIASADAMGVKRGGSGGREDAKISDLARSGGGSADVGSGPATQVSGKAVLGGVDAGSSEHADGIKSVVAKKKGQVQYCYELRLKENPNIGGRLAISVDISGGRVTSVNIAENATGDSAIESCVKSKVRRWRFPPEVSEQIYLPFALSAN